MSLEGQLLDGKYMLVRRIAEGGMSTVYLGVNERIGKDVAVKVLHPVVARDPDILRRFEREARIAARIRSERVADVFDFGELPTGERFMVMEYLEGESLAKLLEREHTIPPYTLATIAAQILEALAAAHSAGVVHRDLKPENVIVTRRGREIVVKVVDFGISKVLEATSINCVRVTAAGAVLGTPLYMSPEQARGQTSLIDHRTDLYSLGVMLYEATAGVPPLTGENVNELLFRVALDEPEPLAVRVPSVDPVLAAIVHTAMAKDPAERYESAEAMREAVDAWRARVTSGMTVPTSVDGLTTSIGSNDGARPSSVPTPAIPMAPAAPSEARRSKSPLATKRLERARKVAFAVPALVVLCLGLPLAGREMVPILVRAPAPAGPCTPPPLESAPALASPVHLPETKESGSAPAVAPDIPVATPAALPSAPPTRRIAPPLRPRKPARAHERRVKDEAGPLDAGALVTIVQLEPSAPSAPPAEPPSDPVEALEE
jgi:serine/threonine protein kinase